MGDRPLDERLRSSLMAFQRNEITEHLVYKRLSESSGNRNKEVLEKICEDELRHYGIWKKYTKVDVRPYRLKILFYVVVVRLLSLTFAIKIMEKRENSAQDSYRRIADRFDETASVIEEEERHEDELIALIDEDKLNYIGSMILGLNDALVELTGTLAGLSFAFQKTRLIGVAGLITGIAAALSMMSSEYLAKKSDGGDKSPFKASMYTGVAYTIAVALLVTPFFVFHVYYTAMLSSIAAAVVVVLFFTYFISVTKDLPFWSRFLEMSAISLGVAGLSFLIGYGLRVFLHVNT
ncbi:MAG: VIT1/CCC1 transporter family protein [Deltaproteobacteria bacterium]|nr:VIT1/CCC1 transporter family protein [Deltaproteobacteria bacterium]MCL5277803.1 VIT1/CCC1 transporter family protein [Deltaproteobacteria bacterium]